MDCLRSYYGMIGVTFDGAHTISDEEFNKVFIVVHMKRVPIDYITEKGLNAIASADGTFIESKAPYGRDPDEKNVEAIIETKITKQLPFGCDINLGKIQSWIEFSYSLRPFILCQLCRTLDHPKIQCRKLRASGKASSSKLHATTGTTCNRKPSSTSYSSEKSQVNINNSGQCGKTFKPSLPLPSNVWVKPTINKAYQEGHHGSIPSSWFWSPLSLYKTNSNPPSQNNLKPKSRSWIRKPSNNIPKIPNLNQLSTLKENHQFITENSILKDKIAKSLEIAPQSQGILKQFPLKLDEFNGGSKTLSLAKSKSLKISRQRKFAATIITDAIATAQQDKTLELPSMENCEGADQDYEEEMWKVKGSEKFIHLGDKNTHFFHQNVVKRQRRNNIN
ncbi:hypothetical protein C5167_041996 [Papaver somniferum]|nr:hypothetical protein C5167_041996 [Papaver somniferum]